MAHPKEIDTFRSTWEGESQKTIRVMEALPTDQYDFRPDPKGRSLGEMAWHLSEIDGCLSYGVVERRFDLNDSLPELARLARRGARACRTRIERARHFDALAEIRLKLTIGSAGEPVRDPVGRDGGLAAVGRIAYDAATDRRGPRRLGRIAVRQRFVRCTAAGRLCRSHGRRQQDRREGRAQLC